MTSDLDIVVPTYFEGESIIEILDSLQKHVTYSFRVLICYDTEEDDTLPVIKEHTPYPFDIIFVKNTRKGLHGAVVTGFEASTAPAVMMMPADDAWNARIINTMIEHQQKGADIVCPSRFMKGGSTEGYPPLKYMVVRTAAFLLYKMAFIPTHDSTNGFRLFSRRAIDLIPIESTAGGTYSIELLVKCHRLGWAICEIPSRWIERTAGLSKFKLWHWIPHYITWFFYGFKTTYLRAKDVRLRETAPQKNS